MSCACVCHTNQWCFYCEMYLPLEEERNKLAGALQRVMRTCEKAEAYTTAATVYHIAYKALRKEEIDEPK